MNFEHFERGYLLPNGCSDLMDVINILQAQPKALQDSAFYVKTAAPSHKAPPGNGELWVSEHITVSELASLLKLKPLKLIGDLLDLGVFASVNHQLDFQAVSQIARKYGYIARKAA